MKLMNFFVLKNKDWNISILVIFVLLASSLIWVLTMWFLKQIVSYTNDLYQYNKAYYFSKAWLELSLSQVDLAKVWYSNSFSGQSLVFKDNFICNSCWFDVGILGKSKYLSEKFWLTTGCDDSNSFVLSGWESLVLPMFFQKKSPSLFSFFQWEFSYNNNLLKYINNLKFVKNQPYNWKVNLWFVVLDWNDVNRDYFYVKSYDTTKDVFYRYFQDFYDFYPDFDYKDYLSYVIISNSEIENLSFCLSFESSFEAGLAQDVYLSASDFFVSSLWNFMWKTVWLQAVVSQPIPDFLTNTYFD